MGKQKVAGTIMLNGEDGSKYFLVEKKASSFTFFQTETKNGLTSLACILEEIKQNVPVDTKLLDLVDLTSVTYEGIKVPLFVFELDEEKAKKIELDSMFSWEPPETLRNVLKSLEVSGVPIFSQNQE
ncbi:hypothetical protein ACFFIF_07435 [Vagococcus entomophilus]|uniref:Uncharacterized protein n=1 Tax=Vagococcus entomophilus TaxID=1160095 RepID=A0A430AHR8_9ENTE|nr:hypothetical protein [Vagococcus entomophilus]RSU07394.1 hypothetical protein CBF30_09100 [Vagococcus entomophilus]